MERPCLVGEKRERDEEENDFLSCGFEAKILSILFIK